MASEPLISGQRDLPRAHSHYVSQSEQARASRENRGDMLRYRKISSISRPRAPASAKPNNTVGNFTGQQRLQVTLRYITRLSVHGLLAGSKRTGCQSAGSAGIRHTELFCAELPNGAMLPPLAAAGGHFVTSGILPILPQLLNKRSNSCRLWFASHGMDLRPFPLGTSALIISTGSPFCRCILRN